MGAGKSKSKKKDAPPPAKQTASRPVAASTANSSTTTSANGGANGHITPTPAPSAPAQTQPAPAPTLKKPEPVKEPEPIDDLLTTDPHEIATDLFAVFCSFSRYVTDFAASDLPFGSPEYIESMEESKDKFLAAAEPIVNARKSAQWIRPLQPFQTGMVAAKAASARADVENIRLTAARFAVEVKTDPNMKSALRETFKTLLSDIYYMYCGVDIAYPEYLAAQIDNTSLSVQNCMEKALQNNIGQYEAAYRVCITESLKLARICNSKGFQTQNVDVQKELGDSGFTCLRASSVLTNLGRGYLSEPSEGVVQNMAAIAKALVGQYQKMTELSKIQATQTELIFTPELIAVYYAAYDAASKLLSDACAQYRTSEEPDETVLTIATKLLDQVSVFRDVLTKPNTRGYALTVAQISRLIQLLCIHVSSLLQPDMDAGVYHMVMNGMYAALHYVIQLNIASISKCLYHPVIPPELSTLCCIRLLFATLGAVLVNAMPALKNQGASSPTEDQYDSLDMVTATVSVQVNAITDLLHYGRPLIIRDEPKPVVFVTKEPETINSILGDLEEDLGLERGHETNTAAAAKTPASTPATPAKTDNISNNTSNNASNPLGAPPTAGTTSPTPAASKTPGGRAPRPSLSEFTKATVVPPPAVVSPGRGTSGSTTSGGSPASNPLGAAPVVEKQTTPAATPTTTAAASSSTPAAATAASSSAPALGAGDAGDGPPGAPKPWTTIPADQISETNLPPGYPPFPTKPAAKFEKGGSEDAYKQWMVDRYNREAAENALIVYKRKLKAAQESVGIK